METFVKYAVSSGAEISIINGSFTGSRGCGNPSVIKYNGKTYMTFRSGSYTFICNRYVFKQTGNRISWYPINLYNEVPVNFVSKNYICEFDTETLAASNPVEILGPKRTNLYFNGTEDIRLYTYDGNLCMQYSEFEPDSRVSMNISTFGPELNEKTSSKFNISQCEKNWMPIINSDNAFVRIAFGNVVKISNGKLLSDGDPNMDITERGSTQLWPYKDSYICIVHCSRMSDGKIQYLHKFVMTDKNLNKTLESDWFMFIGAPVEFTCGMLVDDNVMILPFSVFDNVSIVIKISMDDVISFMKGESMHDAKISGNEFAHVVKDSDTNGICGYIANLKWMNSATKIALMTFMGTNVQDINECRELYVKALCEIKHFDTGMDNKYMHMLIGQDMIRDIIDETYNNR